MNTVRMSRTLIARRAAFWNQAFNIAAVDYRPLLPHSSDPLYCGDTGNDTRCRS
jgi:hypothetical protein